MIAEIKSILWGLPTAAIILCFGAGFAVMLIRRRALSPRGIRSAFANFSDHSGSISGFAALSTALGGTVGIGSITGVGLALAAGGAGSIFWMWICGILCAPIKYAEVASAVLSRKNVGGVYVGGAMYSLGKRGLFGAGGMFAVAGILASFGTGGMTQASAVGDIMLRSGVPRTVTGAVLAAIVAYAVFGGQKRIARISEAVVPAAGLVYIIIMLYIIITMAPALPGVFKDIFTSAFGVRQAAGGAVGYTVSRALSTGVTRCVFSNEAGMGSSPMAHAAAAHATPYTQGLWGIAEVGADTFVFSTLTALALLCCRTDDVYIMFSTRCGAFGRAALPALLVIFAYAAAIAWCYYAESCIGFLAGKRAAVFMLLYRFAAVACAYIGANAPSAAVWDIADILNIFMILPNLLDLFLRRKEIAGCTGTE